MSTVEKREILVCVSGSTPQIITETLYVLVHERNRKISEIRVITTSQGRDKIVKTLFEGGIFRQFLEDFEIAADSMVFDTDCIELLKGADRRPLADIRTEEDNVRAADQICEFIRDLTADSGVKIHASASGGRKTMGLFLMAAMQLYARHDDELSHVLVNEEFESHPDFFYPRPQPVTLMLRGPENRQIPILTESARIELAKIPFIRLRSREEQKNDPYSELVATAQERLNFAESAFEVRLDMRSNTVVAVGREIKLQPNQFFIFCLFAEFKRARRGSGGMISLEEITVEDIREMGERIRKVQYPNLTYDDVVNVQTGRMQFLTTFEGEIKSRPDSKKGEWSKAFRTTMAKTHQPFVKANLDGVLKIQGKGLYGQTRYGLGVPAELIFFDGEES